MTFAVSGGIVWEKDTTNKVLTIKPASSPESGYTSGQMMDYKTPGRPWGSITETYTLVLRYGITNIGGYAFYNCTGLAGSLSIPNSVTAIDYRAFYRCSFTGSLTIPNSVTSIGNSAFKGCRGFTDTLTIGNSVTSVGEEAFTACKFFSNIDLLCSQPISLGEEAFNLNTSHPHITYPVKSKDNWANKDTFPEYDYTKWNFGSNVYVKVGSEWKLGVPYVRTPDGWKAGGGASVYTGGSWKN